VANWWDGRLLRNVTGMRLRTVQNLGSANQVIASGTIVRLRRNQTRWHALNIESDPCPHCGIQVRMSGVSRRDLAGIDDVSG
jgi:hypothetical protein